MYMIKKIADFAMRVKVNTESNSVASTNRSTHLSLLLSFDSSSGLSISRIIDSILFTLLATRTRLVRGASLSCPPVAFDDRFDTTAHSRTMKYRHNF